MTTTPVALQTTIANGAAQSGAISIGSSQPIAIITPAVMTETTFYFLASIDDVSYFPLYNDQGDRVEVTYVVNEAQYINLGTLKDNFAGARFIKLVSVDSEGAAANQAAERALTLIVLKPVT